MRLISEQIKPLREPGETASSSFISFDMETEPPVPVIGGALAVAFRAQHSGGFVFMFVLGCTNCGLCCLWESGYAFGN